MLLTIRKSKTLQVSIDGHLKNVYDMSSFDIIKYLDVIVGYGDNYRITNFVPKQNAIIWAKMISKYFGMINNQNPHLDEPSALWWYLSNPNTMDSVILPITGQTNAMYFIWNCIIKPNEHDWGRILENLDLEMEKLKVIYKKLGINFVLENYHPYVPLPNLIPDDLF